MGRSPRKRARQSATSSLLRHRDFRWLWAGDAVSQVGTMAIWLSTALSAPLSLVLPFLHRDWTLGLFVASQVASYAGDVIYNVTQVSFRQGLCPQRLLGRMNATMRFLVWGTMPLGGLLGGALGSLFGVRQALFVSVLGSCTAFLPVFFSPLRTMRQLPTSVEEDAQPGQVGPDPVHQLTAQRAE